MMRDEHDFQYCQKLVIFDSTLKKVLLCQRKGEQDFDQVYAFAGGKMQTTDVNVIAGMQREKNEELGSSFRLHLYPTFAHTFSYVKKNGKHMILPHYACVHHSGELILNKEEYMAATWVPVDELTSFEPKIKNIPQVVFILQDLLAHARQEEFILI